MFSCKYCSKEYTTLSGLRIHELHGCKNNPDRVPIKRKKILCEKCNKEFDASVIDRHRAVCNKEAKDHYHVDHDGLNCKFCNLLCKNKNSLA